MWLELVNTYGNRPIKLLNKINEKSEIKRNVVPGCLLGPRIVLNSLCKVIMIVFHINKIREGIIQNGIGIISNPRIVLVQLNDKLKMDVEGSKVENRLVIIFNIGFLF